MGDVTTIIMPLHEQAPHRFKSSIKGMLGQFGKQSDNLRKIFADTTDVEEIVDKFINNNPTIGKLIETMRLSAKGRTFALTPLVAKYNKESEDINVHQMYHLLYAEKSIDHVFVQPIDACEGVYYHYELYIPIPEDMRADTPEKLLEDHWEMVHKNTPIEFKELDFQFEPRYTIGRVYGWDGSWMAYSAIVKDAGALWSAPLTEAPYRGTDPFLIIPNGELAILESDGTNGSIAKITHVKSQINDRVTSNKTIKFQERETIEVTPEWIVAHMAITSKSKSDRIIETNPTRGVGEHVSSAAIEKLPTSDDVLEFMKKDVMGPAMYEFDRELIQKVRKSILS